MKICAKIFVSKLDNSQNSQETKFSIDQFSKCIIHKQSNEKP